MRGFEGVLSNLSKLEKNIKDEARRVCYETASDMELYAKENKKWTLRTGDAEKNLNAKAVFKDDDFRVQIRQDLFGVTGEEYGVYLETAKRFHGKYSILQDTQNAFKDVFIQDLLEALQPMFR